MGRRIGWIDLKMVESEAFCVKMVKIGCVGFCVIFCKFGGGIFVYIVC